MHRKQLIKYFCNLDNAQPWDAYVTGTVSTGNDQNDDTKNQKPKR